MTNQPPDLTKHAQTSLALWDIPQNASVTLINVSENVTFLVKSAGFKAVLRIHRKGYNSERAIECELAWSAALPIKTPIAYMGHNGKAVQAAGGRFMVLFHFINGTHPDENQDLIPAFEELGQIAAQMHIHAINWPRPKPFARLTWDVDGMFGPAARWGDWRAAPNVSPAIRQTLEQVEKLVTKRLTAFEKSPQRYGLIHADMRLANLLIHKGETRLIDFDDCGFGWFLYDFAAAISFIEDHPQIPGLRAAWLKGYRKFRQISDIEEAEIDSFIMLRRLALLAWIGSHMEAPEPQALAPDFARVTAILGEKYLRDNLTKAISR
ncbi:MAG: phosphotransferase [Paracoccaceae bacterium]